MHKKVIQQVDVFDAVHSITALIRAEQRKKCTDLKLQLVHFEVLDYLSQSDQYSDTPAATASHFGMTRGTVSQSLIKLEKKGYIEKNKDEVDRRIIHVQILPPGYAILKKARTTELFNKASAIIEEKLTHTYTKKQLVYAYSALQKSSHSQPFKAGNINKLEAINKANIFDVIECIAALIRSEERKRCTELKLQLVHFQVLEYLSLCNKYSDTPAAIANYLGMTRGTVSQSLIILEKRAYIKKNQDTLDKRVFHIQLLQKGRNILKKAKPTELFNKASAILAANSSIVAGEDIFIEARRALQKANNSNSFGVCKTCKNFSRKSHSFFCELTQEKLSKNDSEKICQKHDPV